MTDAEFLATFENCSLPFEHWTHRAHIRVAYMYASADNLASAIDRMRTSIKTYNKATNTPEAIDRGYHETITVAFMTLVFVANAKSGPYASSHEFCDAHPELLSKQVLAEHYSTEQLMTREAKAEFIDPDRKPLPVPEPRPNNIALDERIDIIEKLGDRQVLQLHELIRQQWWGGKRSLEDVRLMVKNTSLMIGLVERQTHRLVGYCRVLTDFVFRATVYDVMVAKEFQGAGLGARLMDTLNNHPKLQRVSFIYLACEPNLSQFYERWGFKAYEGKAEWMIKVQREE